MFTDNQNDPLPAGKVILDANGDPEIEKAQAKFRATLEDWIPKILSAQEPDGYLQTAFTLDRLERDGRITESSKFKHWDPAHRDDLQKHAAQAGVVAVDAMQALCARCDCIISAVTASNTLAVAQEAAQALVFLAQENAGYITGQVLGVNGGLVI